MSNFVKLSETSIVTLIGNDDCESCQILKDYLKQKDIPFVYQTMDNLTQDVKMAVVNNRKKNNVESVGLPLWIYKGGLYAGVPDKNILNNIVSQ